MKKWNMESSLSPKNSPRWKNKELQFGVKFGQHHQDESKYNEILENGPFPICSDVVIK